MLLSLVVPCYNESAALIPFMAEVERVATSLTGVQVELIFIDDGSTDDTLCIMQQLVARYAWVRYYSFSRNFGKESAILAGLAKARGNYTAVMDADLQDPPELLPQMLRAVQEEGYDCVGTRRVTRKGEPPIRSFLARMFYRLINLVSDTKLVDGARDYRLLSRQAVNALLAMPEYNRFSKGLYQWIGFRTKWLEYENVQRVAGETKWSFWKLLKYAIEGILAFSTAPLALATLTGGGFILLSLAAMLTCVFRTFLWHIPVSGWDITICVILLASGVQLLCLGIFGQYLAKAYKEVKHRPHYIINQSSDKTTAMPPHKSPEIQMDASCITSSTKDVMLHHIENEIYNIEINAYPNKNNPRLMCSLSRKNYECIKELYEDGRISVISNSEKLKRFLSLEDRNVRCGFLKRFYRGQGNAAWKCRSSLLREFHRDWESILRSSTCVLWDERTEFEKFWEKHTKLWWQLVDKEVDQKVLRQIFHDERIGDGVKYGNYIQALEKKFNDAKKLIRERESMHIKSNHQWIEAAAQHYGMSTALIDFTKCLDVALYFAVSDGNLDPCHRCLDASDCINSYICIYQFDVDNELYDWQKHRSESLNSFFASITKLEFIKKYCVQKKKWDQRDFSGALRQGSHLFYIDNTGEIDIANLRSRRQAGVLLCLASYSHCALEEFARFSPPSYTPNFKKTLIHKSLIPDIRKRLAEKKIDKEKLGF